MNHDTTQDLRQFIAAMFSQERANLRDDLFVEFRVAVREDINSAINRLDINLSHKIDDMSAAVAAAIEVSNDDTEERLKSHANRITRLKTNPRT
jgi:hypothetical protein